MRDASAPHCGSASVSATSRLRARRSSNSQSGRRAASYNATTGTTSGLSSATARRGSQRTRSRSWPARVSRTRLIAELGAHHPQLLFELAADINEHALGDAVQFRDQFAALPDPEGHFPKLGAHPLDGVSGLSEAGLQRPQVAELEYCRCAAVRRYSERHRALRHGILEVTPFNDDVVEVMMDRQELASIGVPVQLLARERQRDELDECQLEVLADLFGHFVGEKRIRLVGLGGHALLQC